MTEATHSGSLDTASGTLFWLCEQNGVSLASAEGELLSAEERAAYSVLRSDKRRHDWLLGRATAKRLIAGVLAAHFGRDLPPAGIVILRHADGWPVVSLPSFGPAAPPLTLTISHARDRAFCALMFGAHRPLGCDLEAIEPRSPGFVEDYFTTAERDFMAGVPENQRPLFANAIWSSKEAALKAIRRGLAEDTRLVTCLPQPDQGPDGWRALRYRWERPERGLPTLGGWWRTDGGFVLTLAAADAATLGTALVAPP